jgi:hypothetical protein
MATVGFNLDMSHIKPDGIATWKFKSNDDTGHYSFGDLRDAKIAVRTLFDLDSYQRQRPFGIQVDASAKTLNTDKATVLEKLGLLGTESMNQIITAVNGRNYSGTLGFHWRGPGHTPHGIAGTGNPGWGRSFYRLGRRNDGPRASSIQECVHRSRRRR